MDMEALQCRGCGSTNVVFDPKRRILLCNQCGKEEYYSRATLNASGKVVYGKKNAIRFFTDGKMEDARHYAMDVLNISADHAPALYIIAYYDEFSARRPDSMRRFFKQIESVALEHEEVRDMRTLLLASAYNLADFEEDVIKLIACNMQSPEDADDLCSFIDAFSPYLIARRTSSAFFTEDLIGMYQELAEHCSIPKTCFALLKSIETNPDSPYVNNGFFLKSKTRFFFEHYVTAVGDIVSSMRDQELRNKFWGAYKVRCDKYKADAGII